MPKVQIRKDDIHSNWPLEVSSNIQSLEFVYFEAKANQDKSRTQNVLCIPLINLELIGTER